MSLWWNKAAGSKRVMFSASGPVFAAYLFLTVLVTVLLVLLR